ncbi:MAG: ABC transporter permease, partial [Gemmataceae bacterium]
VIGSEPASLLGGPRKIVQGSLHDLYQPDGIVVDRFELEKLGQARLGDIRELNGRRARIVAVTSGTVGFTNNAYIFTTLERARTQFSNTARQHCSYFLVKARPGADLDLLKQRIRRQLPQADVYDKADYGWVCMIFWLTRTGIGISFGVATALGLLVGLAVVAQTLYASVLERLKEFGTLKALGADDRCVGRFLLTQALANAALGSLLGLATALALGYAMSNPQAPVVLTASGACLSVLLVTAVCVLAAWFPIWRMRSIDPASVLRA